MICKNCKRLLPQQINYCNGCGAKVIRNRLTMRNLFEDFAYRYLNFDNKFLRTIKTLFTRPEEVIESYINGTRRKFADVISFFAIAITVAGLQLFIIQNFFPEAYEVVISSTQDGMQDFQRSYIENLQKYQTLYMMAYIPLYALITKIVFFNKKKFNFTELFVVYLYLQGQVTIVFSILTIILLALNVNVMYVGLISMPLMLLYFGYALKRLYKLSITGIVLRTMGLFVVMFILIIIASLGFMAWLFLTESGQEFGAAQKAAVEAAKNKP